MQYCQSVPTINNNMKNCMDWLPTLSELQGPVFLRVVEALAAGIARGLEAIQKESSVSAFLNYQRPGGSDDEREVAAKWLRARVPNASAERLVVYPGNQAVLFNALMSLTSPGDVVLTEALTFPG